MKILKLSFLLVILCSIAYGQDSKYAMGFNVTPTLTSLKGSIHSPFDFNRSNIDPKFPNYESQFGYSAGLSIEYFINKRYSVKSGLAYERKGAKDDAIFLIDDYFISNDNFIRMNFDYLTLPVMGSFQTKGKIKFYMDGGVFLGLLLRQQDKYYFHNYPESVNNNTDQFNRLDFGLSLGLGLRIPLSKKLLLDLGLSNKNWLININKNYYYSDVVFRTEATGFQIGLKYKF